MSELITHEIQITTVYGRRRYQPYHLMQRYAAGGHVITSVLGEVPVHIGIDKTENDGLVTYQSLIMALNV